MKWSKKLSHKKGMKITARAAQLAVLNAIGPGQDLPSDTPAPVPTAWYSGEAKVKDHDFSVRLKICLDQNGKIKAIENNGTTVKGKEKNTGKSFANKAV